jgi:hypothetical protein
MLNQYVYKLLKYARNSVASFESWTPCEGGMLNYVIGSETEARPGSIGIFVFLTPEDAARYDCECPGRHVLKCTFKGVPMRVTARLTIATDILDWLTKKKTRAGALLALLKARRYGVDGVTDVDIEQNIYTVKAVTPVEEVTPTPLEKV